jgi:hypothetical protein
MRRAAAVVAAAAFVVAGCGGGDDDDAGASFERSEETTTTEAVTEATVPTGEGSESCMLSPAAVAEATGVDGWEVTRVEPHETDENRAKCFYQAGDEIVVVLRAVVDDATSRLFDTTVSCDDDTIVDGPSNGPDRSFFCSADGEPFAAASVGDQVVVLGYETDASFDSRRDAMLDLVAALY